MFVFVLAIHVLVSIFLIMVVLLQSGKGGDIASAFGGGGTQTVFGPRGSSNVLTKATTISAVVFMLTSIALVILSQETGDSVLDAVPAAELPAAPVDPLEAPAGLPPVDEQDSTADSTLGESPVDPDGE
jgi:preprotein translocase subunit SecG